MLAVSYAGAGHCEVAGSLVNLADVDIGFKYTTPPSSQPSSAPVARGNLTSRLSLLSTAHESVADVDRIGFKYTIPFSEPGTPPAARGKPL